MITKQDLEVMFSENGDSVFTIKTNVANGHGINGVSYDYIKSKELIEHGKAHFYGGADNSYDYCEYSEEFSYMVEKITDSMVILNKVYVYTEFDHLEIKERKTQISRVYLPFETIQSIEFELSQY